MRTSATGSTPGIRPMTLRPTALVAKSIAGAVSAIGTSADPHAYGERVARRFFPNMLPYKIGTAATFGFAEWNGRSFTDNAPDVMFSIAANAPVRLEIGKESVSPKPSATFPYVPNIGREHAPMRTISDPMGPA
jgi:hypothetical protein